MIVLFGSVGRGESDEQADTDIFVVLKNGGNKLRGEISTEKKIPKRKFLT